MALALNSKKQSSDEMSMKVTRFNLKFTKLTPAVRDLYSRTQIRGIFKPGFSVYATSFGI